MTTALIAEDEPLLRQALENDLAKAWPELEITATVGDGLAALEAALVKRPKILFLDIRMPGISGLEVAAELADQWPSNATFPLLVFVTAYDTYATKAFDAAALDYLLKPVQPQRLATTVARLKARLAHESQSLQVAIQNQGNILTQLRQAIEQSQAPAHPVEPLTLIKASVGNAVHMVPVSDVMVFEAADKYVRVLTAEREYLIRTPIKELLPRLPAQLFWQVHRSTVVQANCIERLSRDESGRLYLHIRQKNESWAVSKLYAHRFKAM